MAADRDDNAGDTLLASTAEAQRGSREIMLAFPIGATVGKRYVIRAFLGEGGMGAVYRALDEALGEEVALKVVRGAVAERSALREEVRIAQKITHRNVCRTFDLEQIGDHDVIKMELVAGETVAQRIARAGRLPIAEAVRIARDIATGLAAAHAQRIVHRDLKPGNVMVADDDRVVLMDFGLAQTIAAGNGSIAGTPDYMAPEQLAGQALDERADFYALGCVVYDMLVGAPRGPRTDLRTQRPDVPRWLVTAVTAMLARDPALRPAGVARLVGGPRRIAPLTAVSLGLGVIAVVGLAIASRPTPHPPAYTTGRERLVDVWDAGLRTAITAKFTAADLPAGAEMWRGLSARLEGYALRWSVQWDAASRAADTDPLLHAQRITCLDDALIRLRAVTRSLADIDDVSHLAGVFRFGPKLASLDDCATTAVLRAQLPAPPPAQRDEVTAALGELYVAWSRAQLALLVANDSQYDAAVKALGAVAARLEAIGSPWAAEAWVARAAALAGNSHTEDTDTQIAAAATELDQAIVTAIREAARMHDDFASAEAYTLQARVLYERDGIDLAPIDAALGQADAALERTGHPQHATAEWLVERGRVLATRGKLTDAIATLRSARVLAARLDDDELGIAALLDADLAAGQTDAAIADARGEVAIAAALGPHTAASIWPMLRLRAVLDAAGKLDAALDANASAIALEHSVAAPSGSEEIAAMDLELRAGHFDRADAAGQRAVEALGAQAHEPDDDPWIDLSAHAAKEGALEAAPRLLAHATAAGPRTQLATYLAFARGAYTDIAADVAHIDATGDAASIGLLAYANARLGNVARATQQLARITTLPAPTSALDAADLRQVKAIVLFALGRTRNARAELEATHAVLPQRPRDYLLAELDAWLGLARLEDGDPSAARAPLEECLAVAAECCASFHYFVPMAELALARALWQTGGDRARARNLATRGAAGFARLGPGRDPDRKAALSWLAAPR